MNSLNIKNVWVCVEEDKSPATCTFFETREKARKLAEFLRKNYRDAKCKVYKIPVHDVVPDQGP